MPNRRKPAGKLLAGLVIVAVIWCALVLPIIRNMMIMRVAEQLAESHPEGYVILIYRSDGFPVVNFNPYASIVSAIKERFRHWRHGTGPFYATYNHIAVLVSDNEDLHGYHWSFRSFGLIKDFTHSILAMKPEDKPTYQVAEDDHIYEYGMCFKKSKRDPGLTFYYHPEAELYALD